MARRRAARVDGNQKQLVSLWRDMGISVAVTSSSHGGFTDTVLGYGGLTVLAEIKDPSKPLRDRKLTPDQVKFHNEFKGAITVVETEQQAIELANLLRQRANQANFNWSL